MMAKHRQRVVEMERVGERIQQLCAKRRLSVVARRAGLHPTHLYQIVTGRIKKPTGQTLMRIAKVLGVGTLTAGRARLSDESGELWP
jgi:transcriptional regulator with XRE-family HTH domain